MEDQIQVTINMPLEKRIKQQEEFNKVLDNFQSYLQVNYGTSNVATATAIMVAEITAQIAINIATLGLDVLGGTTSEPVGIILPRSDFMSLKELKQHQMLQKGLGWWELEEEWKLIPPEIIETSKDIMMGIDPANPNMIQALYESGKWEWAMKKAEEHMAMLGINPTSEEALAYIKELKKMWKLGSGR